MQSNRYFRLILCDNMALGAERCRYELLPWDAPVFHISAVVFYDSEHIEDKPLCTHTKTHWNESGPFDTLLACAQSVKFRDHFLFYSDIINVEYNLHQQETEKVYNSRANSPGHSWELGSPYPHLWSKSGRGGIPHIH